MSAPYDDIINHPHHVSRNHPPMPMHDRAAQFSPFAALVGYEDAVGESIRFYSAGPDGEYTDGSYMKPDNKSDAIGLELIEEILK